MVVVAMKEWDVYYKNFKINQALISILLRQSKEVKYVISLRKCNKGIPMSPNSTDVALMILSGLRKIQMV